jgi:hypothetical protein
MKNEECKMKEHRRGSVWASARSLPGVARPDISLAALHSSFFILHSSFLQSMIGVACQGVLLYTAKLLRNVQFALATLPVAICNVDRAMRVSRRLKTWPRYQTVAAFLADSRQHGLVR